MKQSRYVAEGTSLEMKCGTKTIRTSPSLIRVVQIEKITSSSVYKMQSAVNVSCVVCGICEVLRGAVSVISIVIGNGDSCFEEFHSKQHCSLNMMGKGSDVSSQWALSGGLNPADAAASFV